MSFTAGTEVLLASGQAVPIASLRPGEKVLATDVKTGKTSAEPVTAVLVHHDTNRYDLTLRTAGGTAVIHTTGTHLFWDSAAHRWVIKYGTHLRTPQGGQAAVIGGRTPAVRAGWMWDLTVTHDHDFSVEIAAAAVLAHNCPVYGQAGEGGLSAQAESNLGQLRQWAEDQGFVQKPGGGPETYGVTNDSGQFEWRLKLKLESSTRPGLESSSWVPRFDTRLGTGGNLYINPLTGDVGGPEIGTHVPLDFTP